MSKSFEPFWLMLILSFLQSNTSPACPSTPLTPLDSLELSETNVINGEFKMQAALYISSFVNKMSYFFWKLLALNQSLNKKERRRTVSSKTPREELPRSSSPEIREVSQLNSPRPFLFHDFKSIHSVLWSKMVIPWFYHYMARSILTGHQNC